MVEVVKKRFLLPFGFVDVVILTKQMKELLGETNYERGAWSDREDLIPSRISNRSRENVPVSSPGFVRRTHRLEEYTIYNIQSL